MVRRRSWLASIRILIFTACGFWGFGVLTAAFWSAREQDTSPQVAPLLEKIQKLGKLHTVRYNLHDIYRHERAIEPEGVWGELPGVRSVYRATTRNRVTVIGEGGVEAGVDLARIKVSDVAQVATPDGTKLRITLPPPEIYTPDIKVQVVNRSSGLFWRDENIVPAATEALKARFVEVAQSRRILAEAKTNAVKVLTDMHGLAGNQKVEFAF